jgi:hypothetical protein
MPVERQWEFAFAEEPARIEILRHAPLGPRWNESGKQQQK